MAEKRVGIISSWTDVATGLSIFRVKPQAGTTFPAYKAGQYIAMTRDNCKLTTKVKEPDGRIHFEPALNEDGSAKLGPVTHSYSIASAPFETLKTGELEIYITLEKLDGGRFGRFTESLYLGSREGDTLGYVDRIVGNFTLDQRAAGFSHVVMVGTGTGLAPFVSMMKEVGHQAEAGQAAPEKYTLIHANRTRAELAYDSELRELARKSRAMPGFDFQYVPAVSRPTPDDANDPQLSQGRANNLLRSILGFPTREAEIVEEIRGKENAAEELKGAEHSAAKATAPKLGSGIDPAALRLRMPAAETAVLTCGNADLMEDIKRIALKANFKFEMEEW
jgi:ferredoxin-NADP reductase